MTTEQKAAAWDKASELAAAATKTERATYKEVRQACIDMSKWQTEPPTKDCTVLLKTNSKHNPYVVAGWSSYDKCFYDSNEQKYTKWIRWKRL